MKRNLITPSRTAKTPKAPKTARKARSAAPTRAATEDRAPRPQDLAQMLGVQLTRRLKTDQVRRLRKGLPGYVGMLDDAARQLQEDADVLGLKDVTPETLLATQEEQKYLSAREATAEMVYRAIYEQRLQVDDRGMGMLLQIARRVNALAEEDPNLPARWKFLRDFLGGFRASAASRSEPGTPDTTGAPSPSTTA
ncbi:MAG TPA: hypothetical protein VH877_23690 [Polyangia bacterium]|jgi:hypothetical protein|nr:hypothetical protein [Polyangia bacterium]